jgi:hypothetical protein
MELRWKLSVHIITVPSFHFIYYKLIHETQIKVSSKLFRLSWLFVTSPHGNPFYLLHAHTSVQTHTCREIMQLTHTHTHTHTHKRVRSFVYPTAWCSSYLQNRFVNSWSDYPGFYGTPSYITIYLNVHHCISEPITSPHVLLYYYFNIISIIIQLEFWSRNVGQEKGTPSPQDIQATNICPTFFSVLETVIRMRTYRCTVDELKPTQMLAWFQP